VVWQRRCSGHNEAMLRGNAAAVVVHYGSDAVELRGWKRKGVRSRGGGRVEGEGEGSCGCLHEAAEHGGWRGSEEVLHGSGTGSKDNGGAGQARRGTAWTPGCRAGSGMERRMGATRTAALACNGAGRVVEQRARGRPASMA